MSYFAGSVDLVPGSVHAIPEEGLTLGRSTDAGLRIGSSQIARAHAQLRVVDDALEVVDLGSTNGVQVDGQRVVQARLRAGDRFTLAEAFDFEVVTAP